VRVAIKNGSIAILEYVKGIKGTVETMRIITIPLAVLMCFCPGLAEAQEVEFFAFDALRGTLARDHQPRGVYHAGKHRRTYVAYMDHFFDARVTYYDHDARRWADPVRVDDCRTRDGHNAPAILVTKDGFLHLFYGCHGHPVKYARSTVPEETAEWQIGAEIGSKATYTYGVQLNNGDLLLFYRFGGSGIHSPLRMHRSTDGGATWDDGRDIVDFQGDSWVKIRDTLYDPEQNRVHLALWEGNKKYWNAFYAAYDPDTGHVLAINGADLGDVATKEELAANHSDVVGDNARADIDMVLHNGKPYLILVEPRKDRYYFAHWDGERVARTELPVNNLGGFELYAEGSGDRVVFKLFGLRANDPPTGYSGRDLMVWTSEDSGETWDQGRLLVDRRQLGHGLCGLNLTENYSGDGPLIITQEEWLERSENLPRHRGSILDDAPFRFNKRLYALDADYAFVTRDLTPGQGE